MKYCFFLPLIFLSQLSFSQINNLSFPEIDARVRTISFASPEVLSLKLTAPYKREIEKVRSIFKWITENIEYNVKPSDNTGRKTSVAYLMDDPNDTGTLKPLSERVARNVLSRGLAFCDGYARLFSTLCAYAGIKSEVISGYANGTGRRLKFTSNHRWNAVFIDSSWHLLDVTWASGYISYGNEFVKSFNDKYWMTDPVEFIRDHHPEELQWSLLSQVPSVYEYQYTPYHAQAFVRNHISYYSPAKGSIQASPGDTLHFEITSPKLPGILTVVDTPFIDSAYIAKITSSDSAAKAYTITANKATVTYVVSSPLVEWLSLVFNDEVILRYKLNVE